MKQQMNVYIIVHEPKNPSGDYSALSDSIKSLGNCHHTLKNVWLLATDEHDEDDIYFALRTNLEEGENFLILKVDPEHKQGWLHASAWNWMAWAEREIELSRKE